MFAIAYLLLVLKIYIMLSKVLDLASCGLSVRYVSSCYCDIVPSDVSRLLLYMCLLR